MILLQITITEAIAKIGGIHFHKSNLAKLSEAVCPLPRHEYKFHHNFHFMRNVGTGDRLAAE